MNKDNPKTNDEMDEPNVKTIKSPLKRKINEPLINKDGSRKNSSKNFRKIPLHAVVSTAKLKKSNVGKSTLLEKFFSKVNETASETALQSKNFSKENEMDQIQLLPEAEKSKTKIIESKNKIERRLPKTNLNNINIFKKYITNPNILAFQNTTSESHRKYQLKLKTTPNIPDKSIQSNDIPEAFKEKACDSKSTISTEIHSLKFIKELADDLIDIPLLKNNPYKDFFSLQSSQNELRQVYNMHQGDVNSKTQKTVCLQTSLVEEETPSQVNTQTEKKDLNNNNREVNSKPKIGSSKKQSKPTYLITNELDVTQNFFNEPPQTRSENFFNRMNLLNLNQSLSHPNDIFQTSPSKKGFNPLDIFKNQSDDSTDANLKACNQNFEFLE